MARQADSDNVDDFEIVCAPLPTNKPQTPNSVRDENLFEIVPCTNHNSTDTNSLARRIETPVKLDARIGDEDFSSSPMNHSYLPLRYGSAANIPYEEGFDLKSILHSEPNMPSDDPMTFIHDDDKRQQPSPLNDLLIENVHHRENLLRLAQQTQEDFIKAIHLD